MGALGYEPFKSRRGGGCSCFVLFLLDVPARTGQAPGHPSREFQVTPPGHALNLPTASHTLHICSWLHQQPRMCFLSPGTPPSHPTAQSETWPPVPGLMWGWEQSGLSLIYDVREKKTVQGGLPGLPSIPSSTSCLPPLAARMGLSLDGSRWRVHMCEKGREGVSQLSHSVRISMPEATHLKTLKIY